MNSSLSVFLHALLCLICRQNLALYAGLCTCVGSCHMLSAVKSQNGDGADRGSIRPAFWRIAVAVLLPALQPMASHCWESQLCLLHWAFLPTLE